MFDRKKYDFERNDDERTFILIGLKHLRIHIETELQETRASQIPNDKLLSAFYADQLVTINSIIAKREFEQRNVHERQVNRAMISYSRKTDKP
ncbi:MAG: hypothetical protein WC389_13205 [Lutibacter sp.]|jgi:hypothetical protein